MNVLVGNVIIGIGLFFIAFGFVGIFRFRNFYTRILVTSKVDTVGFLTIMFGVVIRQGFTFASLKVLLIAAIMLVINPLVTHSVARSAYLSGYTVKTAKRRRDRR